MIIRAFLRRRFHRWHRLDFRWEGGSIILVCPACESRRKA
jgi:hypothetical protein